MGALWHLCRIGYLCMVEQLWHLGEIVNHSRLRPNDQFVHRENVERENRTNHMAKSYPSGAWGLIG